jgi:hypothetical protein
MFPDSLLPRVVTATECRRIEGASLSGDRPALRESSYRELPQKINYSWQRPTLPRKIVVPSALESLTAVFGMGTGVASPPLLPGNLITYSAFNFYDHGNQ